MANFSENQVRHLYVATKLASSAIADNDPAGTILPKLDSAKENLYFQYKAVDGTVMRSDLIPVNQIKYGKGTSADTMKSGLKRFKVVLDSTVNSGNPVVGQDYILRITFTNFVNGLSDLNYYWKYGEVFSYKTLTASGFYKKLAVSIAKNMSRESNKLINVYLTDGTNDTLIDGLTKEDALTGTYTGVIIEEAEQPWQRGIYQQYPVNFALTDLPISNEDGNEMKWATITEEAPVTTITNGKKIADLEYFLMGERADVYRQVGWPDNVITDYMVNPEKAYNVIDIHYYYEGANEQPHKSEKDITIVVATDAATGSGASNIITAVNTLLTSAGVSTKVTAIA